MNTKLKSAFIVSIILNVLLLGIFFGTLSPGFGRESSRRERLTAEIEKLPEPARSRFRDKMAQLRAADDPLRDQMRQARNQAIDLLVAEPLDEAAYDKQLIQISQLRVQISKRVADDLKELVRAYRRSSAPLSVRCSNGQRRHPGDPRYLKLTQKRWSYRRFFLPERRRQRVSGSYHDKDTKGNAHYELEKSSQTAAQEAGQFICSSRVDRRRLVLVCQRGTPAGAKRSATDHGYPWDDSGSGHGTRQT